MLKTMLKMLKAMLKCAKNVEDKIVKTEFATSSP